MLEPVRRMLPLFLLCFIVAYIALIVIMVNTLFALSTSISPEDFWLVLEYYVKDPLSGKVAATIKEHFSAHVNGKKLSGLIMTIVDPLSMPNLF